jgi:PAS domain S-box-containing protein
MSAIWSTLTVSCSVRPDRSGLKQAFCLLPGYDWSESSMGTNGAGTALVERRPVAVVGAEHYLELFGGCTCTAAPLLDGEGALLGAIDASSAVEHAQPSQLERVMQSASELVSARLPAPGTEAVGGAMSAGSRPLRPVRWHMSQLLIVAMLPLAVAVVFIGWKQWSEAHEQAQAQLQATTLQARDAIERELAQMRAILETLSTTDAVLAADWRTVYLRGAKVMAGRADHAIALSDATGQMIFNTAAPWGAKLPNLWSLDLAGATFSWDGRALPMTSQGLTRQVVEQGETRMSGLFYGVAVRRPSVAMAVPVQREGEGRFALSLSIPPGALAERLDVYGVDQRIGLALVDRDARVIATNRHAIVRMGDRVRAEGFDAPSEAQQNGPSLARIDGRDYVRHALPLPAAQWSVLALWPTETANASAYRAAMGAAGILVSLLGFTLVAVGLLARRITECLKEIVPAGSGPTNGPGRGTGIREIEQVRQQLARAAEAEKRRRLAQQAQAAAEHREALAWASEHAIRRVLDNLQAFVSVLDAEGRIREINQVSLAAAGLERDDVAGMPFCDCPWWAHDPEVQARIRSAVQAVRDGRRIRFDASLQWVPGAARIVDLQLAPVLEAGQLVCIIAAAIDVSDREQVRGELLDANRHIKEMSERKDDFIAMLSHELRNPLGPLKAGAYLLQHTNAESPQALHARAVIGRQVDHMGRLVDDLLDVTRIVRGKFQLHRRWVDLRSLVKGSVEDQASMLGSQAGARPGLRLALPDQSVWVSADAVRVDQVVRNLLDNAVKFTAPEGSIEVGLELRDAGAVLSVTDSGIGIDPSLFARLFEPFSQGTRSLSGAKGGLGLGLAVVKGITDMHGWRVTVASGGQGKGARFEIGIPECRSGSPETEPVAAQTAAATASRRVLIVDDHADGADTLADIVRMCGHEVDVARNGAQALEKWRAFAPHCVLCDIGLPDIDGYEVARRIRSAGGTTLLVALTGYGQPEDVERALAAGFDRHVVKPIDPELLLRLLAESGEGPGAAASDTAPPGGPAPSTG